MNIQSVNCFNFTGKPQNYVKIDETLSRSAQPLLEDFVWLKEQGVTDIINFRYMIEPNINFDEEFLVKDLGMNYHSIPTRPSCPEEEKVYTFLNLIKEITSKKRKAHIHCMAGADRTGMYAYIYKTIKGLGNPLENKWEWLIRGHDTKRYPNLMNWTENFLKQMIK